MGAATAEDSAEVENTMRQVEAVISGMSEIVSRFLASPNRHNSIQPPALTLRVIRVGGQSLTGRQEL